jgi:hypothetical protein
VVSARRVGARDIRSGVCDQLYPQSAARAFERRPRSYRLSASLGKLRKFEGRMFRRESPEVRRSRFLFGIAYALNDSMRSLLAAMLAAHGVAHIPGFVVSWRVGVLPELPYTTTILAERFDVGDAGIRVVGLLWLLACLGFLNAAVLVTMRVPSAYRVTLFMTVASFALCAVGWPDSRIGLWVNVVLAALLAFNPRWAIVASAS